MLQRPFTRLAIVEPRRAGHAPDPRGARAQRAARRADRADRAVHRGRAARDVRARGRRGRLPGPGTETRTAAATSTTARSRRRWSPPARTPRGSAGASWPRIPRLPTCASGSGSSSSAQSRRSCGSSATRSPRSGSQRSAESPSRRGAAARWRRSRRRSVTRQRIGFPLMIKAAAGGGGRGIRRVDAADGLAAAFRSAQAEAEQAFGDGTLLLERLVAPARHIEVQVIADGQGTAWAIGVRDCSCQRRHQKVIEESASPALTAEQDAELRAAAQHLALRAGYRNAGTVEFLYEPDARRFCVHGGQRPAAGRAHRHRGGDRARPREAPAARRRRRPAGGSAAARATGHAVEARLNAEDAALGFLPAPGRVALLRLPTGPRVRVDTGVAEGDAIPEEFDSMIAKLIAWGARPRRGARAAALRARGDRRRRSTAGPRTRASCSSCSTGPSCAPVTWTRPGWTGCSCRATSSRCATPTWRSCRRRSRSARPRRRPTARVSTRSPAAAGRRPTPAPLRVVELRHRGQAYRARSARSPVNAIA